MLWVIKVWKMKLYDHWYGNWKWRQQVFLYNSSRYAAPIKKLSMPICLLFLRPIFIAIKLRVCESRKLWKDKRMHISLVQQRVLISKWDIIVKKAFYYNIKQIETKNLAIIISNAYFWQIIEDVFVLFPICADTFFRESSNT